MLVLAKIISLLLVTDLSFIFGLLLPSGFVFSVLAPVPGIFIGGYAVLLFFPKRNPLDAV